MKPCPTVLKVMCIIGISWAAVGLLGVLSTIALYFIPLPGTTPAFTAMKKETWYIVNIFISGSFNIVTELLLLVGSIKSLKAEKSGRLLLFIYVWSRLVFAVIGSIWTVTFVMPHTFAASMPVGRPMPPGFETILKTSMYVGAVFGFFLMLVMPIYILITMRLRKVRDAYDGLFLPEANFEPIMNSPTP